MPQSSRMIVTWRECAIQRDVSSSVAPKRAADVTIATPAANVRAERVFLKAGLLLILLGSLREPGAEGNILAGAGPHAHAILDASCTSTVTSTRAADAISARKRSGVFLRALPCSRSVSCVP